MLTWIVNRKRVRRINVQEQFITAYGGLRGAVGFSLVEMIDSSIVPPKQMFVTTTLAVVMFTVFFQVSKFNTMTLMTCSMACHPLGKYKLITINTVSAACFKQCSKADSM